MFFIQWNIFYMIQVIVVENCAILRNQKKGKSVQNSHVWEEEYLQKLLKTRLLYLKYILEQPEESKGRQIFRLQVHKPLPGDWASTCLNNIKLFKFDLLFEKIRQITKQKYTVLLKEQISMVALKYLLEKQGKKVRSNIHV